MSRYSDLRELPQSSTFEESNDDVDNSEQKSANFQYTFDVEHNNNYNSNSLSKRLFSIANPYRRLLITLLVIAVLSTVTFKIVNNILNERAQQEERRKRDDRNRAKSIAVKEEYLDSILATKIQPTHNMLIGISCGTHELQRRHLMRVYQIEPYKNFPITFKFFTGRTPPEFEKLIKAENDTYGDIVVLTDIEDTREAARHIKPYYWFEYVEKMNVTYTYVGKMDTDTFMNIPLLFKDYFSETVQNYDLAAITHQLYVGKFYFTYGPFYALSWKFMLFVNRLHEHAGHWVVEEDIQIAVWCGENGVYWVPVAFDYSGSYEFSTIRNITDNAVKIHDLKSDADYLLVANCFDSEGINKTAVEIARANNWGLPKPKGLRRSN